MLVTGLSWICILFVFWASGMIVARIIKLVLQYEIRYFHSIIVMGMVTMCVYSEFISVFHRVSRGAFLLALCVCVCGIVINCKTVIARFSIQLARIESNRSCFFAKMIIVIALIILGAYLSSRQPSGYDTYNYHAPSIRWIEEYGLVKGLGNLHTRFAYNSSFLCLQALFSFSWLYKMSLHSMNGFIWIFMGATTVSGLFIFNKRFFSLSDLLRVLFLFVLFRYGEMAALASPHTDFLPMCLTAYIFIEWCRLIEEQEKNPLAYGLLAMLGLFAASVKLSAGILFVFALVPLSQLIAEKRVKDIICFFVLGFSIMVPFFLRNIIISGYLIYPVATIDIFNFDWEIPKSVVISDSAMIKIFARAWGSGYSYSDYLRPFAEWIRIWIRKASPYFDVLFVFNLLLSIPTLVYTVYRLLKDKAEAYPMSLLFVSVIGFWFLFLTAPATRFGTWWFYSLPCIVLYYILGYSYENTIEIHNDRENTKRIICFSVFALFICTGFMVSFTEKDNHIDLMIEPRNYSMLGTTGEFLEMNGYKFYYYMPNPSNTNNLNDYNGFPGTECLATLSRIEMRGDTLADGFKVKELCRDIPYDFQGEILPEDMLQPLGLEKYYK